MAPHRKETPIAQVSSEAQEHMETAEALNDELRRLVSRYPHDPNVARASALSTVDVEHHNLIVMKQAITLAWEKGGITALRNPRSRLNQLVREGGGDGEETADIA